MNSFMVSLQKFFKNKNTVTIVGVILIILILFFGYRYQINKQVSPVKNIPVAATTIQPRTKITNDMIAYIDVAPIVLQKGKVITNVGNVVGKYSNYNTLIPEGSMFYNESVIREEDLPDAAFVDIEEGQIPYNFHVTMDSTYGNAIYTGNYIDIYMKAVNKDNKIMVGKLIENVKVLAVKDSSGRNVFENSAESRTPAFLIFGVVPEINILLRKASYMSNYSVELFPVPHGITIEGEEGETTVSSETLKSFINSNSVANDEIDKKATTTDTTTVETDTSNTTNTKEKNQ